MRLVQREGNRDVRRDVDFYNLDTIIDVGYRVNSNHTIQFRILAIKVLREFIVKAFVLSDERLKQGIRFEKDYFDELLYHILIRKHRSICCIPCPEAFFVFN